jgi:hypothetical protein
MVFCSGKGISFYGGLTALDFGVMKVSIVLDGGTPVIYKAPSSPPSITNNLIYQSPPLSDGTHTIVVTAETEQLAWADYFLVTPSTKDDMTPPPVSGGGGATQTASAVAGPPGTSGSGTSTGTGKAGSSVPSSSYTFLPSGALTVASGNAAGTSYSGLPGSSSSEPLPALSTTKSRPTATIAAATLGALLFVALLLATFLCLRLRRRRHTAVQGA